MNHGWEKKRLGDICEVLDSLRKPVTKRDRNPGPYPYYGATGIQDYVQEYIFDGNYLLVGEDGAKWGANEKTAYSISGKSWVNNHAHILNFRGNNVTQRFIEFFLYVSDLNRFVTGAVVPKLTQKNLISIPVPLPPVELQERIVRELDKLNELIELKRKQLKDLETLAHSLFYETFGDPNHTPLFELKSFGSVSINLDSRRKPVAKHQREAGLYPYYGASGIVDYVSDYIFDGEFLLISEDGANLITRSKPIAFIAKGKTWINNHAHVINFDNSSSKIYVLYYMNTLDFREKITGAAQPKLTQKALNEIFISWPPIQLQNEFAEKIEAIEEQKRLIESSISDLETLLASRMDYWFND